MTFRDLDKTELEYADRSILAERLAALQKERAETDQAIEQLIGERDEAHEAADKLAQAVAEYFDVEIGEHSNTNDPWLTALVGVQRAIDASRTNV